MPLRRALGKSVGPRMSRNEPCCGAILPYVANSKRILLFLCLAGSSVFPAGAAANPLTSAHGISLAPEAAGATSSACPASRPAFSGGFYGDLGAASGLEITGFKLSGSGWRVLASNSSSEPRGTTVESYCTQQRRPPPLSEHGFTVSVTPFTSTSVVSHCPPDESLLAGGFRNSIDPAGGRHVVVDGMRRVGTRGLRVSAVNLSSERGTVTAYAYCGHAKRPIAARRTVAVAPESSARLVAECPGHRGQYFAVFGGFQGAPASAVTGATVTPAQLRYFARSKIVVTAVNRGSEPGSMTVYVYCRRAAGPAA
jgi:hypothetical protein